MKHNVKDSYTYSGKIWAFPANYSVNTLSLSCVCEVYKTYKRYALEQPCMPPLRLRVFSSAYRFSRSKMRIELCAFGKSFKIKMQKGTKIEMEET